MTQKILRYIFIGGLCLIGALNLFISVLTFAVKSQKYGLSDLWQNPDSFAIITFLMAIACFIGSYWLYHKKFA